MKITLMTDPHLGVNRQAHTTRTSAQRLQDQLYEQAMGVVQRAKHPVFCLGDLFDKAFNQERIIAQGIKVASGCRMTLSGNHDETNREGTITSLQLVEEAGAPICRAPDLSNPYFEHFDGTQQAGVYMVPHHASQELFLAACQDAANHAAVHRDGMASVLMLHCNYDFPLAITDNTLNLPAEFAEQLLENFDLIFIGHEHNGSTHLDGRVVVMGNTHPTSFHDVGDKYIYHLDLETAEYEKELIWSEKSRYREVKLGEAIPDLLGVQFVDVVGQDTAANAHEVSQFMAEVWKAGDCVMGPESMENSLLAVRNKVALKDSLADVDTSLEQVQLDDLETALRKDLAGSDLLPIFEELLLEAKA